MSTPLTGGKGHQGSSPQAGGGFTSLAPFANELIKLAGGASDIAGQQTATAQPLLTGGLSQYEAGLTGQLTPAQQAAEQFTANEMGVNTAATFGRLGLGGSTMAAQDRNANELSKLAQEQGFLTSDELLGLQAMGAGGGFLANAVGSLGEAGSLVGGAGQLTQQENVDFLSSLTSALGSLGSLGGQSSGGGTGLLGSIGNLFSKSAGSGGTGPALGAVAGDVGSTVTPDFLSTLIDVGGGVLP